MDSGWTVPLFQFLNRLTLLGISSASGHRRFPYKGTTPAVTDLVAGQVQVMFDVTPTSLAHTESSVRWA
jgi:tripartite-type tricarboxylate transporter receptor subunit TctC